MPRTKGSLNKTTKNKTEKVKLTVSEQLKRLHDELNTKKSKRDELNEEIKTLESKINDLTGQELSKLILMNNVPFDAVCSFINSYTNNDESNSNDQ